MILTVPFLVAVIVALIAYINRVRIEQWLCLKSGRFTVFRATYLDGRTADYFAYSDDDKHRLARELSESRDTGRPFSVAGAIASYEIIDGHTYNQSASTR